MPKRQVDNKAQQETTPEFPSTEDTVKWIEQALGIKLEVQPYVFQTIPSMIKEPNVYDEQKVEEQHQRYCEYLRSVIAGWKH